MSFTFVIKEVVVQVVIPMLTLHS